MRPLIDRRFKCSGCGSMFVAPFLFATHNEADAWATPTASESTIRRVAGIVVVQLFFASLARLHVSLPPDQLILPVAAEINCWVDKSSARNKASAGASWQPIMMSFCGSGREKS